ncbi:restriction endonuclease subunit S [Cyanobium gracile UHCC 0139]|uniref:Restriction endonuclease subunit S n=1 Tax=Cyanobium gracile UHCC 0139 TaxID=3110308 RepID=A0ABU5RWI2_9CYAN|nr:restriction endonuclease subunit S [Cyanobium gracile]MEA5392141.1 restriction endonuclease subunit S [Cyanobium gracile UHCC 0139]
MSFPRYPAHKDSGVEWLGEVPEHWDVKPLKRLAEIQTGLAKGKEVEPEGSIEVPFLRVANVQDGFLDLNDIHTIQIPEAALDRYLLRPGDVLMNEGGDFDKLGRGCIWNSEIRPCIHQNHVFAVRPHSISSAWLNVYTSSKQANSYFIGRSKQSTNLASISSSNLMDLPVPVAPIVESTQILNFLDRETAKIDTLIYEQHRLIVLLQEKRQAVISRAVTKGLNPDVPMKDSGVEWLGEVPEHWDVSYLVKQSDLLQTGPFGSQLCVEDYVTGGIPVINPSSIIGSNIVAIEGVGVADETAFRLERHKLRKGDLVVARRGEMGRCAVVGENETGWLCGTGCLLLRCATSFSPDYVELVIKSEYSRATLSLSSVGSTMENLNTSILGRLRVPVPPKEDQVAILGYLQQSERCFESLITDASNAIRLLEERRSALISAAVTGQIDVLSLVSEAVAA